MVDRKTAVARPIDDIENPPRRRLLTIESAETLGPSMREGR